jgi:hypothetical protein
MHLLTGLNLLVSGYRSWYCLGVPEIFVVQQSQHDFALSLKGSVMAMVVPASELAFNQSLTEKYHFPTDFKLSY